MSNVTFITGNPSKAANFAKHIGMEVAHRAVDLDEIQTIDHCKLVEHKVRQAYTQLQRPVLVEDVAFSFEAWNGLPGPFVKFFVDVENGLENMCRMLDGFESRRAFASCMFGYYDGEKLQFFEGRVYGNVVDHPRGENGYGYDALFAPDGFDGHTAAELDDRAYARYYTAVKPFADVREFLQNKL